MAQPVVPPRQADLPAPIRAALDTRARDAARLAARLQPRPERGPRGAALLLANGEIHSGPELGGGDGVALSAERVALYAALIEGTSRPVVLLVRGGSRGGSDAGPPTAATLQVLAEFAPNLRVHWGTPARPAGGETVRDLLPGAFGAAHLPGGARRRHR